ncbi:hypothetical protein [Streptosporangium roseum]|uniref:Uncharacterized protein n=1 Tax=Streptosporangium roseum (strain ATCC 12428 / DSM 43021 / JCM 3005 / KCTC 9067 / NCIMB 10171 / NRRL 2505 / NI 9100) TaxID=479432 RepID=D2BF28_STRRD|nr:hypothetical protein [Streptosporangium roseum]ACZ86389.1 hypothetical protein Sros_3453 [Streptosporangium roseum DSM 43021]
MYAVPDGMAEVVAAPGDDPVDHAGEVYDFHLAHPARLPTDTAGRSQYGAAGPRAVPAITVPARRSIRGW